MELTLETDLSLGMELNIALRWINPTHSQQEPPADCKDTVYCRTLANSYCVRSGWSQSRWSVKYISPKHHYSVWQHSNHVFHFTPNWNWRINRCDVISDKIRSKWSFFGEFKMAFFDMKIHSGWFLLFSLSRSDVCEWKHEHTGELLYSRI